MWVRSLKRPQRDFMTLPLATFVAVFFHRLHVVVWDTWEDRLDSILSLGCNQSLDQEQVALLVLPVLRLALAKSQWPQ